MRKLGFHHLQLPSGQLLGQSVVTLDAQGRVEEWHPLLSEEPFTEWLGGTAILVPGDGDKLRLKHPTTGIS